LVEFAFCETRFITIIFKTEQNKPGISAHSERQTNVMFCFKQGAVVETPVVKQSCFAH